MTETERPLIVNSLDRKVGIPPYLPTSSHSSGAILVLSRVPLSWPPPFQIHYTKTISIFSIQLALLLARHRPTRIIFLGSAHEPSRVVLQGVGFWERILKLHPQYAISFDDSLEEVVIPKRVDGFFPARYLLLTAALLAILCLVVFSVPAIGIAFAALLLVVEFSLRLYRREAALLTLARDASLRPWSLPVTLKKKITPPYSSFLVFHHRYGFCTRTGNMSQRITIPELGSSHTWSACIRKPFLRNTGAPGHDSSSTGISLYGCSITFGAGIDDNETFGYKLQQLMPTYIVRNYGVPGFSLYQSLLALEDTLPKDQPEFVVLGFHSHLEQRNTNDLVSRYGALGHMSKFTVESPWQVPSCTSAHGTLTRFPPSAYCRIPLAARSCILQLAEAVLNAARFRGRDAERAKYETTCHLLLLIRSLVEKHNSKLIIACLDESSKYYGFLSENKFSWCMTGISRSEQKPEGGYRWTLHPFDGHPTSEANDRYAEAVHAAIEEELLGTHAEPGPALTLRILARLRGKSGHRIACILCFNVHSMLGADNVGTFAELSRINTPP